MGNNRATFICSSEGACCPVSSYLAALYMEIQLSRQCNRLNLVQLSKYLGVDEAHVQSFYDELLADSEFLNLLNSRMAYCRDVLNFSKGIIGKGDVDSVDWFSFQRILLYVLIRLLKPENMLETGVYYGGNSIFMLHAFRKNGTGLLTSIDLPDSKIESDRHPLVGETEHYDPTSKPGFLVPVELHKYWNLIEGSSLDVIPTLADKKFNLYLHDSEHSFDFLTQEMTLAHKALTDDAIMIVDDINWSNGFFAFCVNNRYVPLLLTDNGKNGLLVRNGLISKKFAHNGTPAFTGS